MNVEEITTGDELLWDYGIPTTECHGKVQRIFCSCIIKVHPSFQMHQELSDVFAKYILFPY